VRRAVSSAARAATGVVDSLFGEQCDDGVNDGGYGECAAGCDLGERCGDGVVQSPMEECDDGNSNDGDTCHNDCSDNIAG
jgi:cysteine-rich repeat protein